MKRFVFKTSHLCSLSGKSLGAAAYVQPKRRFTITSILYKDEDKSKQALKKLGLSLQGGNIKNQSNDDDNTNEATNKNDVNKSGSNPDESITGASEVNDSRILTKSSEDVDSVDEGVNQDVDDLEESLENENHEVSDKLQQLYESVAYMTPEDLLIQENLDEDLPFNSFESLHYLDRKSLLRGIANEIDIFNTPMSEIKRIYEDLTKLDDDRSVQLKYFKRYLKNYDDPVIQLLQQFNKINDKFKLLRRREIDNLALAPNAFLYRENLCDLPYNVLGFDRSITGLPLRTSEKNKLTDKCYPQEFIEDLQMFRTKIQPNKRDLNFIEIDETSNTIDPSKLGKKNTGGSLNSRFEFSKFLNSLYEELEFPKNAIYIKDIKKYQNLEIFSTYLINEIEYELLQFKKVLQKEIEMFMASSGSKILIFSHQDLKFNQFKLGENETKPNSELQTAPKLNNSLVIINYNFKNFNLIPGYGLIINSRRQYHSIYKHLFKIFLINLEDQIDTLFRIKYYNQSKMKKFMKSNKLKIHNIIKDKLIKIVLDKRVVNKTNSKGVDALIYKPNDSIAFKRIYWLDIQYRNTVASMKSRKFDKKQSFNVIHSDFNEFINQQINQPRTSSSGKLMKTRMVTK